jgi:hypothetical protein
MKNSRGTQMEITWLYALVSGAINELQISNEDQ